MKHAGFNLTRLLSKAGRPFLFLFLIVYSFQALAQTNITWSETLTSGLSPSQAQCTNWTNFLNQLTPGTYLSARLTGTFNPTGVTINDPAAVAQLANLMFNRIAGSVTSGGHTWVVGIGCNGPTACGAATPQVELSVDQPTCNCSSTLSLRPHIGNLHWGGVGTSSCSPPTQTLTIQFQKSGSPPVGQPRVLLVFADDLNWINEVRSKLLNTGSFSAVDIFDARTNTPSVATLQAYHAVLLESNFGFANPAALGDNLASYIDIGGGVVSMVFATASIPVGGRFNSQTYLVINPQSQTQGSTQLMGQVFQPGHPIMQNVTSFNGGTSSYRGTSNTITPGSVRIANWTDGLPLVAVKEFVGPAQVRRADLNFFPPSSDSRPDFWVASTHGATLMANALKWVSGFVAAPTITMQPAQQTNLCAGQSYPFSFSTTGTFNLGNFFRLELSNSSGSFSSPMVIGQAGGPGTIIGSIPSFGVPPGAGYRVRVISTSPFIASNDNGANLTIHPIPTAQITGTPPVTCPGGTANVQVTLTGSPPWTIGYSLGGVNSTFIANSSPALIPVQPTQSTFFSLFSVVSNQFGCSGGAGGSIPITVQTSPQLTVFDFSSNNSAGECGASSIVNAIATGNPLPSLTYKIGGNLVTMPYFFPVGTTEVTVLASNTCGTDEKTVTVTVNDIENPILVNPPDILANNDPGLCSAEVILQSPDATDNCGIASMAHDQTDNVYPVGETIITWTATDVHGNTTTAAQKVIVTDNEGPQIIGPDVLVNNDPGLCEAKVTLSPDVTDNCGVATIANNHPDDIFPVGETEVVWTATDIHGNTSTAVQKVTVTDVESPLLTVTDVSVSADAGACSATLQLATPPASDNCDVASITNDQTDELFPVGETIVTWTATDIHGNTTTQAQTVIVTDNEAPQIIGPDVLVHNDPGLCSAKVTLIVPDATDNCGVASITNDQSSDAFTVGETIVTWTAVDIHGNTTTQTQKVIVTDDEAPQIIGPDVLVHNDPGLCSAKVTLTAPTATDNCGIASITNDQLGDIFPVGQTDVTWTATDIHGNTSTTVQRVIVTDVESPVLSFTDVTVKADLGRCSGTFRLVKPPSLGDNCGVASLTNDHRGDVFPVGETIVTWIATDLNGNNSSATQKIIVIDTQVPGIGIAPDITVDNSPGSCSATVVLTAPPAKDNCGIATVTHDQQDDVYAVGETIVTWTATDANGLTATSTQKVIVINTDPVIESVSLSEASVPVNTPVTLNVTLTDNNAVSAFVNWGDQSQSTIDTSTGFSVSHTYANAGNYGILVTVTDACGTQAVNGPLTVSVTPASTEASVLGAGWFFDPDDNNHWSHGKHKGQDKATFAFVAKSGKKHPTPVGQAIFKLQNDKLFFMSTSYESLEVDGFKAFLKGKGKVNGKSGYKFLVSVIDGDMISKKSPDKIRIKISNSHGQIIYDNQNGAPDNAPASMPIKGGQIIIFERNDHRHHDFSVTQESDIDKKGSGEGTVLSAWPNPFTDALSFKRESYEKLPVKVQLIDITGLPVYDHVHEFSEDGLYHVLLNGDHLRSGVYILKVNQGGRVDYTKLLRN